MNRLIFLFITIALALSSGSYAAESSNLRGTPDSAPFGAELFQGHFATKTYDELNADYVIMPGDRIAVRIWGAKTFESVLSVDTQGNLFLPEVGPVKVAGVKNRDIQRTVQLQIATVYEKNVEVYTNLLNTQPVPVFVTGYVVHPGRYAGGPTDSVLYYLDLAGGIDPVQGSYRDIRILRNGEVLQRIDLYSFLLEGIMPRPRLQDGDVLLVGPRGPSVLTLGYVRVPALFEFPGSGSLSGQDLASLATPLQKASHASIVGTRGGAPYNTYKQLDQFLSLPLEDGDRVQFHADTPGDTIMVAASGAIVGASRYPVSKSTRLLELLKSIPVEPELANIEGVHIKRKSVALQQKKALDDSLRRLEQSSLTATSQGVDEANIRVREAELISQFVAKAREIQPEGTVVVRQGENLSDIYLEDGDVVVIPYKSDVVLISGEVLMPQAIVYSGQKDIGNYVASAGGFSKRADKRHILVVKPNGEVLPSDETRVSPGDQVLVLPKVDSKNMQVLKDISQILYQVAVATSVALSL